jgi:DNA-binding beta-propeller fold protein YncE
MRMSRMTSGLAIALLALAAHGAAFAADAPYKVLRAVKSGGDGGFDYVYADSVNRKLYAPRSGDSARVSVFDLDTLTPLKDFAGVSARGATVDAKSGHGFSSSKPVAMWDAKTLAPLKTIDVQGNPDGILGDPADQRIYILSHVAPNVTVINAIDGSVVGTIDLGGMPEQSVSDGKGHLYIDLEDKNRVAVVDAKSLTKTGEYDPQCSAPAGLAFDTANHVLFVACRTPAVMAMLNSDTGKILATLPIGPGTDGAVFNPATKEAFSSQGDGTLTVVKEISPTSFAVEQTVQTQVSAKTLTLDRKTNHVLLIAADFGPVPADPSGAPPPARRPTRGPMLPGSFAVLEVGR